MLFVTVKPESRYYASLPRGGIKRCTRRSVRLSCVSHFTIQVIRCHDVIAIVTMLHDAKYAFFTARRYVERRYTEVTRSTALFDVVVT